MLNLTKGRPEPLATSSGSAPSMLRVGVGWESNGGGKKGLMGKFNRLKGVDLDLSVIGRDASGTAIGGAYFDSLQAFGGALRHTGDNTTGKGAGYDEVAYVDLSRMPGQVSQIDVCLSSYKGADFSQVNEATCGVFDDSSGDQLAEIYLPLEGNYTACLIARLTRGDNGWSIEHIAKFGNASTWQQMRSFR